MNKHFITTWTVLIACFVLSGCAEEKAANKATVDVKAAANSRANNVKAAAAGQKPATPGEPAAVKDSATAPKSAAKVPAVPTADGTKAGAAPTQDPKKVAAVPTAGATKAPAAPPAASDVTKAPGAKAQTAAKVEDPPPALSVPAGFHYSPRGRRDPFVNPVPKKQADGVAENPVPLIRPDGLPGVLVSEVKLSGIVHSADKEMSKAMLVVGRNTYFAKKGDSLFDGVVKEIRTNEVVFAMVSATTRKSVNRDTVVRTGASFGTSAGEKK